MRHVVCGRQRMSGLGISPLAQLPLEPSSEVYRMPVKKRMGYERCDKTGLLKDQCRCDDCQDNPTVFVTEVLEGVPRSNRDRPGIREGHFLADLHGRDIHPVRRVTTWEAESGGLLRHRHPPRPRRIFSPED